MYNLVYIITYKNVLIVGTQTVSIPVVEVEVVSDEYCSWTYSSKHIMYIKLRIDIVIDRHANMWQLTPSEWCDRSSLVWKVSIVFQVSLVFQPLSLSGLTSTLTFASITSTAAFHCFTRPSQFIPSHLIILIVCLWLKHNITLVDLVFTTPKINTR